jgi:hypothetical protein
MFPPRRIAAPQELTTRRIGKDHAMNLQYAVDRLYQTGWTATSSVAAAELERLPDGRLFPAVRAVKAEFARAGLDLSIKHNAKFHCYRSAWAPVGQIMTDSRNADARHGTVIGACEREAAVYALAQLREAQAEAQLATV